MRTSTVSTKPTSLKLPADIKSQLEDIAQNAGLSLHAFMVQTLTDSVKRAHLREAFAQDSFNHSEAASAADERKRAADQIAAGAEEASGVAQESTTAFFACI